MTPPEPSVGKLADCRELHARCEFCDRTIAALREENERLRAALKESVRIYDVLLTERCPVTDRWITDARRVLESKEEP